MKKLVVIIIGLFLITGCTNVNELDYNSLIEEVLNIEKAKSNTYLEGYKLYLPQHMTLIGDLNNNNILYSYGDKYYLYVDLISYYNKKENKYNINHSSYEYTKDISYDGKTGYVVVSKSNGGFLVETMYNFAKIEVVTNDIKKAITDSLIVLNNIEYNYKIIDSMIGNNTLEYDSEVFTLLGPNKNKTDNFLTYEEEYGVYNEEEHKTDEDMIEIESMD